MNAKARIKQLEKTSGLNSGTPKIIFMYDAGMMGMPDDTASFDGVQMTQAKPKIKRRRNLTTFLLFTFVMPVKQ